MNIKIFLNTLKFKRNTRGISSSFDEFMRKETYRFSPSYARRMVSIHGGEYLVDSKESGGILLFLHHGSFFLSGGSIIHKLGLNFSLIASGVTLNLCLQMSRNSEKMFIGDLLDYMKIDCYIQIMELGIF